MGSLESVRSVREHLRDAGAVSLDAVTLECGVEAAALGPLLRERVDVQKVAVVDGDVLRWIGEGFREAYTPRHLVEGALRVPYASEGERKQVTVVGRIGDDLRMDYTAQGQIVALAQRMESIAEPDSCRMTTATAGLVAGYFDVGPIGRQLVKGSSEPVEVFELIGPGQAGTRFELSRSRGLTRFVGRGREMDRLMAIMARSGDGQGQVVGIEGEAGTGKSRLCHEFAEFCREWGLQVFHAHAPAHARRSPLAPIRELVRRIFHIMSDDAPDIARAEVASRLARAGNGAETAAVIAEFLGLTTTAMRPSGANAESRQRLILDAMTRSLGHGSASVPDIVIVEDVHWIDEASSQMLSRLVARIPSMPVMLIANLRPGSRPEWLDTPHAHQLPLSPLGPESRVELLASLLGSDSTSSELAQAISSRAGGNPFFIEEMVRMLAETGSIEPVPGGYRLVSPVSAISIPRTVHAILASRIDRLDAGDKAVLQSAAVIGLEFTSTVLARACGMPAEALAGPLDRLERNGFLHRKPSETGSRHAFEHQLTHEVARRRTHAAVALAIEQEPCDRIEERAGEIAFRREEAGEPLAAAAEIALVSGDHRNGEAPDLDRAVADAIGIAERIGSPFFRATTLDIGVASAHLHFGRNRDAIDALRESLLTIRDHGTYVEGEARVLARLADALWRVGDFDEARSLAAEAINRGRELGTVHYEALSLVVSARLGLEAVGPGYAATAKRELASSRALVERTAARWLLEPIRRLQSRADGIDATAGSSARRNLTRWS